MGLCLVSTGMKRGGAYIRTTMIVILNALSKKRRSKLLDSAARECQLRDAAYSGRGGSRQRTCRARYRLAFVLTNDVDPDLCHAAFKQRAESIAKGRK
jgi:hypothetical protein